MTDVVRSDLRGRGPEILAGVVPVFELRDLERMRLEGALRVHARIDREVRGAILGEERSDGES